MNPSKIFSSVTRTRLIVAVVLVLLPLVYFFPAVIGEVTLAPGDGWTQIFGIRVLIGQMLRDGQLPLWNPYIFAGMPLLASIHPGALYPPTWLFAVFSPATAMNIVVITTYHLALIGTYLYARRIGMTRIGRMIAGVAFTFGGFMIAHWATPRASPPPPGCLDSACGREFVLAVAWRWVAPGRVFIALQLFAGEPQMNFYTILVGGAYVLFSLFLREERERRADFLFGVAAMSVCGAAAFGDSTAAEARTVADGRARARSATTTSPAIRSRPANILTFVFPFFFGGAELETLTRPVLGGMDARRELRLFRAADVAAGAGRGLRAARRRLIRWFWGGMALVSLTLSFG